MKARVPEETPLRALGNKDDGSESAGWEPMRDLKEAGVQNRHLSESEPSVRGAAGKAANLGGCKSLYRQLPETDG